MTLGVKAFKKVSDIPEKIDLAVISTPAKTVPGIIEECGKAGITGIVIISAGFKEIGKDGKALETEIYAHKKKYGLKIIGPNCLGIIRPGKNLNATFAVKMPKPGKIAFISQSGALGTATLDWAIHENIGFSAFVSIGSMIDVDFGELIDYFGSDPETRSILLYIEGITDARKFISAARHFARTKPIIVVKAGRYAESAKAAASHTGSMTGEDAIYDAAFKRAGIVRVNEISDLFNCSSILGMQPLPQGRRLAIITNAGGPGILATDALISKGGKLAELSEETMKVLNEYLPPFWSRNNPIDILGDAGAERYEVVLDACLKDKNVDGILLINTVQGVADPLDSAKRIVKTLNKKKNMSKTILTSFIGMSGVEKANREFVKNNIPTYPTPEQAIDAYMYMYQYKRNLELLYETPEETHMDGAPPKRPLMVIMRNAAKEGREILTEAEAKQLLDYYEIPVVRTEIASNASNAIVKAHQIGFPVAMKILSPQITHKTDIGGVALNLTSDVDVKNTFESMVQKAKEVHPEAKIEGVTIQPMLTGGYEVIIGSKTDSLFGPVIVFGTGGTGVEIHKDIALGLPPLNQVLAKRMMEETRIYKMLKGFRNKPPADIKLLEEIMVRFSNMLIDFPQIKEIDINPLLVDEKGAFALDARVVIDKDKVLQDIGQHSQLVISPYPKKYETVWKMKDGRSVILRPIKPEDEEMWLEMFNNFSEASIRFRFFQFMRNTSHEVRVRYCNIDYDREMAIIPELEENGKRRILGVARIIANSEKTRAELAIIVADPWQGLGLGSKMMDYTIEIAKDMGIHTLVAEMMIDNKPAIELLKKMGFEITRSGDGVVHARLDLINER
ncbi:MAG: bifunctional acetate--CoA ligase family protein/GNAT family N-acetyltransferase [Thermoplasmata archaeon]|nr:bifunctional acetate--CoA ligase family protein/GNAT family N-acetyltransferase [Thermoplasmata archaeon]